MRLFFFTEARFDLVNEELWAPPPFSAKLWNRYLEHYSHVYVVARVRITDKSSHSYVKLNSNDISIIPLNHYIGFKEFLKYKSSIQERLNSITRENAAFICRVPGNIGTMAANTLRKRNIPYALEVVGDPWESLSFYATESLLSPLFRIVGYWQLRKIVRNASAVLYVTEKVLQNRYPTKNGTYTTFASNVILTDSSYSKEPKKTRRDICTTEITLVAIGSLEMMYKAPDIVLKSVSKLIKQGYNIKLVWLGGGRLLNRMVHLAEKLHISRQVNFMGNVGQDVIRNTLKEADLYVHASLTEGLPRALIEAMAYGLPCIGTRVGGIPELLDSRALIKRKSVNALSDRISMFVNNPIIMEEEASRNWHKAREYHSELLSKRRNLFFQEHLKLYSNEISSPS